MEHRSPEKKGFLFFASDQESLRNFLISRKQIRTWSSAPIELFCPPSMRYDTTELDVDIKFLPEEMTNWRLQKLYALKNAGYDKVIYLDADTLPLEGVQSCFELLDSFDLLIAPAPKKGGGLIGSKKECLEKALPEMNGGFIAFNNISSVVKSFFNAWEKNYRNGLGLGVQRDQASLFPALVNSRVRFYVLPEEYNLRLETSGVRINPNIKARVIHSKSVISLDEKKREKLVAVLGRTGSTVVVLNLRRLILLLPVTNFRYFEWSVLITFKKRVGS